MNLCINARILAKPMAGAQRYLKSILDCLPRSFSYHLISPKRPLGVVRGHLWEQTVLPLRLSKNDILWSPCQSGPIGSSRQVVTVHDILHIDRPDLHVNSIFAHKWYGFMLPRLLKNAMGIITISLYTKGRLLEILNVPEDKIRVIYNGVNSCFKQSPRDDILMVKKKYGIKQERYVLFLGTLDIKKNLGTLLKAWKRLGSASDIQLVLAGKKHDRLALKNLGLDDLPVNASFTGYVADDDLPALYSGASCFVFPSLYEGFGRPPLEAMACGTPVIASNVTAIPEVCGDAALYTNPLDVDDIAEKIKAVLENSSLAEKMRTKGLVRAEQFSLEKCAEDHAALFTRLN